MLQMNSIIKEKIPFVNITGTTEPLGQVSSCGDPHGRPDRPGPRR